jgi:UDP-N-acetyl-D-galactosamine dehydrogenase
VTDPFANPAEVREHYGLELTEVDGRRYDLVVGAVPHLCFRDISAERLASLAKPDGTIADLKGIWRDHPDSPRLDRWSL